MVVLKHKLWRDLKRNFSQFLTIFLMTMLGVFVFSGIHSYMDGMKKGGEEYYKENNLADLWVNGENFSSEDVRTINEIPEVEQAERISTTRAPLEDYEDTEVEVNFIEENNINNFHVVSGVGFSPDNAGVWLDHYLAENLGLEVDDELEFNLAGQKISKKIVGLIAAPDHVYFTRSENEVFPVHDKYGFIYLSAPQFQTDFPEYPLIFSQIAVDSKSEADQTAIKNLIGDELDNVAVTDRDTNISYRTYNSEIEEGETYSNIFTALFMFIALLSVVTTMNRFVRKEREQIGALKALGIKDGKITWHYVSYGFYLSLIASILGVILGSLTLGLFFLEMEKGYFIVPNLTIVISPIVYAVAAGAVGLVTLVTYWSTKSYLKKPATELLRMEVPKVKKTKFTLTTKGLLRHASMSTKWNLRDIARSKARSVMGLVGITGACMLVVCAFGMLDTMYRYLDWEFQEISNYQYKLIIDPQITPEQYRELLAKYPDSSMTVNIDVAQANGERSNRILFVTDAGDYVRLSGQDLKLMEPKNQLYATEKLAEMLKIKAGDTVKWQILGTEKQRETKVAELYREPQNQNFFTTREFYEDMGLTYRADTLYTNDNLSDVEQIPGVESIQNLSALRTGVENMLNTMKTMVLILIAAAVVLGFVIINNLSILSLIEKQYQFATLKVLGFSDKRIRWIFIKQNIWLTMVSVILGIPLGFFMVDFIFKSALSENYDFPAFITPRTYLIAGVGTLLVSLIINFYFSRKIKTIDMVSSLKGNE